MKAPAEERTVTKHGRPEGSDARNDTLAIVEPDLRLDEVQLPELPEAQLPESD